MKKWFQVFSAAVIIAMIVAFLPMSTGNVEAFSSEVYINEIQVSTASTDWEFVELQGLPGTSLTGLSLIGIESDAGTSAGTIDLVISLDGQQIPANGFWLGISPTGSSTYGVSGDLSIAENSFENSSATYFLVSDLSASRGEDLDTNNDGVFDITPWTEILDSINITDGGTGDLDYGAPSVGPDGSYLPSGTYRCGDAPWGSFNSNFLNFSTANGTPGYSNRSTCDFPNVYLNEMQVSTTGTDWEFFEIQGEPGTDLSSLTLIGIEADAGDSTGRIDKVISLSGQSIPADGFWVGINLLGATQYGITGDLTITDNSFENSTAVYLLVQDFTGAQGNDLDSDDDGVLDSFPWSFVLEGLSIRDSSGDFNYGTAAYGPDGSFLPSGIYRCPDAPVGAFSNSFLDFSTPDGTPGASNNCEAPPTDVCGDPFTPIYEIQGSGDASLLDGDVVSVEGIVTADFQDSGINGFFIQDPTGDGDAATSDGIFVYSGVPDVNVGEYVRVNGTVDEFFTLTELTDVNTIQVCDTGLTIQPTLVTFPDESQAEFEPFESMLVEFEGPLFISEYFNYDRYGEIVLTPERQYQGTAIYDPGPDAVALAAENAVKRITLDDGRTSQNPDPAIHPNGAEFTLDNLFRGGDVLYYLTGVMDYRYDLYRLQPVQGADYYNENPRTETPDEVGGNLKVASFNVLNYFTTLGSRGADTALEFERQRAKIFAALMKIDADIVGLIEIENNTEAIEDLVTGLNELLGDEVYAYLDTGAIGTDEIKVAFIYKPATVGLVGDHAILDSSVDPRFIDTKNRPALAQTFMDTETGGIFTVVVNHLKSKGSSCDDIGDPDLFDGAGNCNITRTMAAEAMVDWLASDPTGSGDPDFLIIGDLNSYTKEDPIDSILEGSDDTLGTGDDYFNMVNHFLGDLAYSYVFDGQLGYLDHGLANVELFPQVSGTTIWHINADEPDLIDYDMSFKQDAQDALYASDAYRSSDHDPVIIGLDTCDAIPPTLEVTADVEMLWPVNHKYVDVTTTVLVSDNFDTDPVVELVSVTSNEPDDGLGDGDTPVDIVIIDDYTFQLRAERSGVGDGRIYTITYKATDDCGNETYASVYVYAPFSMGK
ncbi:MAG: hypothetical protein CL609_10655 [Anaerolineaceae bacterium]|nr:hypothetical protein [Anaerolineaceae bacterium]